MGNKYKFTTDETTVKKLSNQLNEPEWLLKNRLGAFERLNHLGAPMIERVDYSDWDLWEIPENVKEKSAGNHWEIRNESKPDERLLVVDFKEAIEYDEALFSELYHEAAFTRSENLFQAFTMAYLTDSLFIYIPENMQVSQPIELSFQLNNQVQKSTNRQVLIYGGANSSIEMIERYTSKDNEEKASANISVQILADVGAKIQYTSFDQFGENTTAFVQREAITKKDAVVNFAIGVLNEGDMIEDIQVHLDGQGSSSDVKTVVLSYNEIHNSHVNLEHEAKVSKVSEEQLYYLMSRGLTEQEATEMIVVGFVEPISKELPMEYAVELNRLISFEMEGSVG